MKSPRIHGAVGGGAVLVALVGGGEEFRDAGRPLQGISAGGDSPAEFLGG